MRLVRQAPRIAILPIVEPALTQDGFSEHQGREDSQKEEVA